MVTGMEILAIVLITILMGSVFFYGFRRPGPWGSWWSYFLVLFLAIFMFSTWIEPVGPYWEGVAWVDFAILGLVFALLLAAASPPPIPKDRPLTPGEKERLTGSTAVIGLMFWILIILLLISIPIGLYQAA